MTQTQIRSLLDRVLEWPAAKQVEAVRMLEALEHAEFRLDAAQHEGVRAAVAAADRGEFATDAEVEALWKKWGV